MISFDRPLWLIVIMAVPLAWFQWTRLARSTRERRWIALIRPFIFLTLVFALAGLNWRVAQPGLDVVALLDVSDSMFSGDRRLGEQYVAELGHHMKPNDRLAVIAFGRDASMAKTYQDPQYISVSRMPDTSATNIERALQIAVSLAIPDRSTRIVLVSDGQESVGSVRQVLPTLVARGIAVDVVPIAPTREHEVLVEEFSLPADVKQSEPFVGRAVITSTLDTDATAYLFRNEILVQERRTRLLQGRNRLLFDISEDAGFATYEIRIEAPLDTFLENNVGQAVVTTTGQARALLLTGDEDESDALYTALLAQNIVVDRQNVAQATFDARSLIGYAAVILHNVSGTQLSLGQMEELAAFVRQTGGGLLIIGGNRSYGLGAYAGTPLESMAPVQIEGPDHLMLPSLAMVLVIDKSGSMSEVIGAGTLSKLDLAKEAVIGVTQSLEARDLLGVIAFDNRPHWTVPVQSLQHKEWFIAQTLRLVADGGTHAYPALEEAYQALRPIQAAVKHIIMMSDGYTIEADFETLSRRIAADRITVSAIGVGDADQELLAQIAQWGQGRYYYTDDPYRIPYIFAAETRVVSPPQYVERPTFPIVVDGADFLHGLPQALPQIRGYAITYPKQAATVHLSTDDGLPLLTSWRYGLGRVVAYTSGLNDTWGSEWPAWSSFAPFWAQTVRWTMRPSNDYNIQASVDLRNGEGRMWVDALDESGAYVNFLTLEAAVHGPDATTTRIMLEQTGPGRYEAMFAAQAVGTWAATITSDDTRLPQPLIASATLPYSEEYRLLHADLVLLTELAKKTGGLIINDLSDIGRVWIQPVRSQSAKALWPWLIFAALVLFITDIGVRYIPQGTIPLALKNFRAWILGRRSLRAPVGAERLADTVRHRRNHEIKPPQTDSQQGASRAAHSYLARRKKERQASKERTSKPAD